VGTRRVEMLYCFANGRSSGYGARFIVEYAKSGRSGCKECGGKIAERSVRLGSITRIKGYDTCNWHHPKCYLSSKTHAGAVEEDKLQGFATLKESDKAALRSLTLSAVKGEASESTEAKIMEVVSVSTTTTTTTTPEFV